MSALWIYLPGCAIYPPLFNLPYAQSANKYIRGWIFISKHRLTQNGCSQPQQGQNLMNDSFAWAHKFWRTRHINKFQSAWLSYCLSQAAWLIWIPRSSRIGAVLYGERALCIEWFAPWNSAHARAAHTLGRDFKFLAPDYFDIINCQVHRNKQGVGALGARRIKISFSADEQQNFCEREHTKEKSCWARAENFRRLHGERRAVFSRLHHWLIANVKKNSENYYFFVWNRANIYFKI